MNYFGEMKKQAALAKRAFNPVDSEALSSLALPSMRSRVLGMFGDKPSDETLEDWSREQSANLAHGAGSYRLSRRLKATAGDRDMALPMSEYLGKATAPLLTVAGTTALGGYIGSKLRRPEEVVDWDKVYSPGRRPGIVPMKTVNVPRTSEGLLYGLAGGVGLAVLLAALGTGVGFLGKTPATKQERSAYNAGESALANYLVPGMAHANSVRRYRMARQDEEDRQATRAKRANA